MDATMGKAIADVVGLLSQNSANDRASETVELAAQISRMDSQVFWDAEARAIGLAVVLGRDVRRRGSRANEDDIQAWGAVRGVADWERFREPRIAALRASLGQFPTVPQDLHVRVTGTLEGRGYRIDNLVFESRPGLWVT